MSDLTVPWTVACQAPLSMGFPRQEYWSGLLCPPPGIFLTQGSNPCLLHWQACCLPLVPPGRSPRSSVSNFFHSTSCCIPRSNWSSAVNLTDKIHLNNLVQFSSVQLLSCVWLFATPWTAAHQASVHHQLPEFTQTHVHWVSDAIQLSHPLSSSSPPNFNLSQHQSFFKWVSSLHHVAKVLEFQLQHQSFQWICRTDFL